MTCASCGSEAVQYLGVVADDTTICDQWRCEDCGHHFDECMVVMLTVDVDEAVNDEQ